MKKAIEAVGWVFGLWFLVKFISDVRAGRDPFTDR